MPYLACNVGEPMKTIILLLTLVLFSGCGGQSDERSDSVLVIGVMPSMDYLPLAVAVERGYLSKGNCDLVIQRFFSANERDAALQAGKIDGCVIDYTGAILLRAGGMDVRLTSACDGVFYLVAGRDSGIASLEQARNKSLGIAQHTVIEYFAERALADAGLKPQDVVKVELNRIPIRYELLINGKIDMAGLPDPLAFLARAEGGVVLTDNRKLGLSITGVAFLNDSLKKKAGAIREMYAAWNKGVDFIRQNGTDGVRGILVKEFGFPEDLVSGYSLPPYSKVRPVAAGDIERVAAWLAGKGLIKAGFDSGSVIDASFAD